MTTEYKLFIKNNVERIRTEISELATGKNGEITLLAATKTVDAETVNYAVRELNINCIGENKVQELVSKYPLIENKDKLHIHFIGHLQTNKVRKIIDKVEMIQSLDSMELAREIGKRAVNIGKTMDVLVEVNSAKEENKGGVLPENVLAFVKEAAKVEGIRIKGLMTMGKAGSTKEEYKNYFSLTEKLFSELKDEKIEGTDIKILSMGMSGSYKDAVMAGANMVRIGSLIFGKRVYPEKVADITEVKNF